MQNRGNLFKKWKKKTEKCTKNSRETRKTTRECEKFQRTVQNCKELRITEKSYAGMRNNCIKRRKSTVKTRNCSKMCENNTQSCKKKKNCKKLKNWEKLTRTWWNCRNLQRSKELWKNRNPWNWNLNDLCSSFGWTLTDISVKRWKFEKIP